MALLGLIKIPVCGGQDAITITATSWNAWHAWECSVCSVLEWWYECISVAYACESCRTVRPCGCIVITAFMQAYNIFFIDCIYCAHDPVCAVMGVSSPVRLCCIWAGCLCWFAAVSLSGRETDCSPWPQQLLELAWVLFLSKSGSHAVLCAASM